MIDMVALPLLALIALLLLGGIVAVVALLANPKTRAAGAVLLAIGFLVLVLGGLMLAGLKFAYRSAGSVQRVEMQRAQRALGDALRASEDNQPEAPGIGLDVSESAGDAKIPLEVPVEATSREIAEPQAPTAAGSDAQTDPEPTGGEERPAEEKSPGTNDPPEDNPAEKEQPADTDAASGEKQPPKAEAPPQWVGQPPHVAGDVYRTAVKTDPLPNLAECEGQLPKAVNRAVSAYAQTELNRSSQVARQLRLDFKYVEDHILKERWPEPVEISLGKWVQLHALLEFDQKANDQIMKECALVQVELDEKREKAVVVNRLCYSGVGVGSLLAVLAIMFACLKIDQVTQRPCRGRLVLGAIASLLAVGLAAGVAIEAIGGPPRGAPSVDWAPVNSVTYAPPADSGHASLPTAVRHGRARIGIVILPIALLLLGGIVTLVAYRRTRVAGLVLLAVVVTGAVVWAHLRG